MKYAYLNAKDKLDPRRTMPDGERKRMSKYTRSLTQTAEDKPDLMDTIAATDSDVIIEWPEKGSIRAMCMLRLVYGFSTKEIAILFGVTSSRVSELLAGGRAEVHCGARLHYDMIFEDLSYDVSWIDM
ncbi:MAG: hypothetical protein ACR2QC_01525 [Gammaproteobacteria bacterium]